MAKKNNTVRNALLAGLALFLFLPKRSSAAPGGGGAGGTGNGYTPTEGSEGTMNESYLGITPNGLNRGIRNNNPGNIKFVTSNQWNGKVPMAQNTDAIDPSDNEPTFEQFIAYPYGIRAMIYLIKNSYIPNGHDTIKAIMDRYDSGHSNDYINYVIAKAGKGKFEQLSAQDEATIKKIVQAIARFENGQTGTSQPEVITDIQYITARNLL